MPVPRKGLFKPKHPEKYIGDVNNIVFRSGLEKRFMKFFDEHNDIINWGSEEFHIKYFSQVDNKVRRYFPDFIIRVRDRHGNIKVFVIEIKPKVQTVPPKTKRQSKRYVQEMMTWQVNQDKWKAAEKFCDEKSMKFMVLHEGHLKNVWG